MAERRNAVEAKLFSPEMREARLARQQKTSPVKRKVATPPRVPATPARAALNPEDLKSALRGLNKTAALEATAGAKKDAWQGHGPGGLPYGNDAVSPDEGEACTTAAQQPSQCEEQALVA